ncbi:hypothetical protein RDn1_277 [Candidatus Termititenax dinenymphae]|uniref:PIN domain-containing protein n=1 Tax=Candidatus Termititenax dinenymphae TaxID=2218523 RepID=A0A388TJY7_9BACT|nr:hypothetical protein RDn1_277 [Candidatus Termititenax dinenymphae]
MDNCCFNRPFDDQSQERVHIESEAVLAILKRAQIHIDEIVGSDILNFEINQMADPEKQRKVKELQTIVCSTVKYTKSILVRATEIMNLSSMRVVDSLHIACAEKANCEVLLTTDDKLEKASSRVDLSIKIMNPLKYLLEV